METKSHAKAHLWLKACASRFLRAKGISHGFSYVCRQHLILGTWKVQVHHHRKGTSFVSITAYDSLFWTLNYACPKICFQSGITVLENACKKMSPDCAMEGTRQSKPIYLWQRYLNLKYLRYTSSKLASISSSITLER